MGVGALNRDSGHQEMCKVVHIQGGAEKQLASVGALGVCYILLFTEQTPAETETCVSSDMGATEADISGKLRMQWG